jgi:copper transport protein
MEVAFGVARAGTLLGVLLAAGGVLFELLTGGRARALRPLLVLAFVSVLASFVLDAALAGGFPLGEALDGSVLREQAGSVYGRGALVRLAMLVALTLVVVLRSRIAPLGRGGRALVAAVAVAAAASLSVSGHAVAGDPLVLRMGADMVHGVAAAIWIGGLVQLLLAGSRVEATVVERFSRSALASVIAIVVTGTYLVWYEVGLSLDAATDTTYGRLVLAKVGLLLLAMPLAAVNRSRNVPALRAAGGADEPVRRLRRFVLGEVALLVVVVALTAWLVQSVPAKDALRPGFVERTVKLGSGTVQLVLDPASVGRNELHLYALDRTGQPDVDITDMTITAGNPKRDIERLPIEVEASGPGHYTTSSATLPYAGRWTFTINARVSEFEERRGRFEVDVAPAS